MPVIFGVLLSGPIFLFGGYKYAEYKHAADFMHLSLVESTADVKTYTKMAVLLSNDQPEKLAQYISLLANSSYHSMTILAKAQGVEADPVANEYYINNKSKLVPVAP